MVEDNGGIDTRKKDRLSLEEYIYELVETAPRMDKFEGTKSRKEWRKALGSIGSAITRQFEERHDVEL